MFKAVSRIAVDVKYNMVQFFRNKQAIFITFVFPAILLVILGYLLGARSGVDYLDFLLPGILGVCILFSAVNWTMGAIVRYRATGIFQKMSMTPLSSMESNMSRIITGALIVMLSVTASLLVAWLVFGVRPDINVLFLSLVLAGSFISAGLGMIMAYLIEDVDSVNAASFTLIIPLIVLSGSLFPVERLPSYLQFLSILSPLTYLTNGLRSAMFAGDAGYAITNLAIVIFLGFVLFCAGAAILMGKEGQA
ncbi:MAG TPA: ABC transporter permease [Methanocella sp.]|nr:ABC transporter permease [Methanocella sp.]